MTRFAVRQHDPLRSATGQRHHLNLLLHDYEQENLRTYEGRAAGLLSGSKLRQQTSQVNSPAHSTKQSSSTKSIRYAHQLPSLTEQALAVSGPVQLGASLLSSTGPDVAATFPVVTHETQAAALDSSKSQYPPSWLTPQQLQSRQLGMKVARMMNSHRTPIGAFANFDMPVAP